MKAERADTVARFNERAQDYARYRPSYPSEAIDAIFEGLGAPKRLHVVDVGAGTGISMRLLAERGADVLGIEPNDEMRAVAEAAGLNVRSGMAGALDLASASVDVVACFQAFHWFAVAETVAEFVRVLRPGGRIAVVFNERDDKDPFTLSFGTIVDGCRDRMAIAGFRNGSQIISDLLAGPGLSGARLQSYRNSQYFDYDALLGRVRSTSYAPREGQEYDKMTADLKSLFERFASDGEIEMVYRTDVYLADRL